MKLEIPRLMSDLPSHIGRYRIVDLLGRGGMGLVYLARDPAINRSVVIKVTRTDDAAFRRRFLREARAAGCLSHDAIVTIFDAGECEGKPFIVMEYVEGRTVGQMSRLRNSWGWRLGAVLNSPGKHPFALDRRLDAGSGGPAARREVEVGLFRRVADRASEHRWVTDAGRAPRGVAGGALVMSPGVRAGRR